MGYYEHSDTTVSIRDIRARTKEVRDLRVGDVINTGRKWERVVNNTLMSSVDERLIYRIETESVDSECTCRHGLPVESCYIISGENLMYIGHLVACVMGDKGYIGQIVNVWQDSVIIKTSKDQTIAIESAHITRLDYGRIVKTHTKNAVEPLSPSLADAMIEACPWICKTCDTICHRRTNSFDVCHGPEDCKHYISKEIAK